MTEELVIAIANNKNCCHAIHLPVQAGSDEILKKMNRRYTSKDYLDKVAIIKKHLPDCAITTDIMVGFPGETEQDFLATIDLVKKVGFASAFTFVYSPRKGTIAAEMPNQIDEAVKKDRIMRLVDLCNEQTRQFSATYLNKEITILCEDYDKKRDLYLGRDQYGRMGYFKSQENLIGEFVTIKVNSATGISLYGDIVEE